MNNLLQTTFNLSKNLTLLNAPKYSCLLKPINLSNLNIEKNNISCNNCAYYMRENIKEHSQCLKFGKKEIEKNMDQIFEYATDCRNDETKCGKNAMYFRSNLLK
jgi:hypothetical protein